jgi:hypothetical protein
MGNSNTTIDWGRFSFRRNISIGHNHDEPITVSDFREGARSMMGLGYIAPDIAQSAFNIYDHNRKGYLDQNEASGAYGYLERLYS